MGNAMKVEFTADYGSGQRYEVIVVRSPAMIGRSPDAALSLSDPCVSRRHCEVEQLEGVLVVRDLGSRNGTYVDGHRATEALLMPGHSLHIGATHFVVQYEREVAKLETARVRPDDLCRCKEDDRLDASTHKKLRQTRLAEIGELGSHVGSRP